MRLVKDPTEAAVNEWVRDRLNNVFVGLGHGQYITFQGAEIRGITAQLQGSGRGGSSTTVTWAALRAEALADLATLYATLVHASRHQSGAADAIKLDDLATPDDNADLNASTSNHGLLPKLGGGTVNFLRADGTWAAPSGGGTLIYFGSSSTGNDSYAISPTPALASYTDGTLVLLRADVGNTGACSLNVSSLGAKAIKRRGGAQDLDGNDIVADEIVLLAYDASLDLFQLLGLWRDR